MKRLVALLTLASVLFLTGAAWAQGLPTAKPEEVGLSSERLQRVSRALRGEIDAGKIPGAVALVARKGRVVYFESFGVRDKAVGDPMPKDAIFRLYSMTKPFTSVAAMMLMEDGKLLLTDPVSKFLPQLAKREVNTQQLDPATGKVTYVLVPADREMTIQDLLRHTSGLVYGGFTPNARIKELYEKEGVTWDGVTPDEQIQRLAKVPLAHQPGTTWEYSVSTDVLGRVIEKVSGTTLGRFLDERLFGPLKMSDTAFVVPADKVGRLAQPFAVEPSTGQPIKLVDVTVPPKNDAGGAGTAGNGGRLRAVRTDAAQRRPARGQSPAEPDDRCLHDVRPSRLHEDRAARRRGDGLRLRARLRGAHGRRALPVSRDRWASTAGAGRRGRPSGSIRRTR